VTLRLFEVNLKARDDAALGRFWAQALGWTASGAGDGATSVSPGGPAWPDPAAVRLDVIAVPDPENVRTRVHLDLAAGSAAHRAELVARLRDLGATPAGAGRAGVPWTVLADPEGNAFCVLEPREPHRDTGPVAAVVVDCADPRAAGRFWAEAMGWTLHEATADHALLRSAEKTGPCLEFVRTPHAEGVRHRAHLDLAPYPFEAGVQVAEVARLERLGAVRADAGRGGFPWKVLADPEGNEFCVLGPA
jgi:predicted enzyme related to lactoylglutathione lyase